MKITWFLCFAYLTLTHVFAQAPVQRQIAADEEQTVSHQLAEGAYLNLGIRVAGTPVTVTLNSSIPYKVTSAAEFPFIAAIASEYKLTITAEANTNYTIHILASRPVTPEDHQYVAAQTLTRSAKHLYNLRTKEGWEESLNKYKVAKSKKHASASGIYSALKPK
ncbi:MAG: hypothetical protein JST84_04800 [Acidobacteria bacterium]|nr:hypothetical protein [Acidobacteriota bacterium]